MFDRVRVEKLRQVFRTERDVLMFTASGTGAFESAYANLLSPGDRVLCVVGAGNFGDRWIAIGAGLRRRGQTLRFALGRAARRRPGGRRRRGRSGGLALVVVVHSETSTGATADIRGDRRAHARARRAARGRRRSRASARPPLETDAWGLDVVVTG